MEFPLYGYRRWTAAVRTGQEKTAPDHSFRHAGNGAGRSTFIAFQRLQLKVASRRRSSTVAIVTAYMSLIHVRHAG
jgi:hypothetical protein